MNNQIPTTEKEKLTKAFLKIWKIVNGGVAVVGSCTLFIMGLYEGDDIKTLTSIPFGVGVFLATSIGIKHLNKITEKETINAFSEEDLRIENELKNYPAEARDKIHKYLDFDALYIAQKEFEENPTGTYSPVNVMTALFEKCNCGLKLQAMKMGLEYRKKAEEEQYIDLWGR